LASLKIAVPKTGRGLEIGVGTGRFAQELWQTLLKQKEEVVEQPLEGHGKGGFVVIKSHKAKRKK